MFAQQFHSGAVNGYAAHLVSLSIFENHAVDRAYVVLVEPQDSIRQVDVVLLQGDDLTSAGARDGRQPDVQAPLIGCLPCRLDDARHLLRSGRP